MSSTVLVAHDATAREVAAPRLPRTAAARLVALAGALWLAAVSAAISLGAFELRFDAAPDLPIVIVAAIAVPVATAWGLYARVAAVRDWVLALDPRMVFAVQHARLLGAGFIFAWVWGELPAAFAAPAAFGDIATGLAAYGISAALLRGPLGARRFWGFTALGLGDFALAIALGAVVGPAALDHWPLAFFPGVAVPFFAIVHLVTIAQYGQGLLGSR